MQRRFFSVLATVAAVLMAGCTGNTVYDKFEHTPTEGWEKGDNVVFCVPKATAPGNHQATVMLRTNDSYPFLNLSLIVEQKVSPSGTTFTDTLNCTLADKQGNSTGKGLNYHQFEFPLRTLSLAAGDSLTVSIRHDMKRDILPGISDVGFALTLH